MAKFPHLESTWQEIWKLSPGSCRELQKLMSLYSAHDRHYHDLKHIEMMLKSIKKTRIICADPKELKFAVLYHDIIYLPGEQYNEKKSADIALDVIAEHGLPLDPHKVEQMILSTIPGARPVICVSDEQIIQDADMVIFGQKWPLVLEYNRNIQKEYSRFPDDIFREKRKEILQFFLDAPEIYRTMVYSKKYSTKARENLRKLIDLY